MLGEGEVGGERGGWSNRAGSSPVAENGLCYSEIGTEAALPVVLPDLDKICDLKEQRQWRIFCVKRLFFDDCLDLPRL